MHEQGTRSEVEQPEFELAPIWDIATIGGSFTLNATVLAPILYVLQNHGCYGVRCKYNFLKISRIVGLFVYVMYQGIF